MSSSSRTARGRRWTLLGHPIGVRGDLAAVLCEHPADRLDPEAVAVFVDEGDYLGGRGSSSRAKKAEAAFKIGGFHQSAQRVL